MLTSRTSFAAVALVTAGISAASAWTPPPVGPSCRASARSPVEYTVIAGNYLGGRAVRDGIVDRKSFQGCFRDIASCETWLAKQAIAYPLPPGIATCTPVRIGGRG